MTTGKTTKKNIAKAISASVLVLLITLGSAVPAGAASLAKGTIGTKSSMALATDFVDANGRKHVLTVSAFFGAKTATSVFIQKIRLCYSVAGPTTGIYVRPEISREKGNVTNLGVARNMIKDPRLPAPCTDWTVNKTYSKASSGEVFRVTNYIVMGGHLTTIAAFFR